MINTNKKSRDIQIKKLILGEYDTNCYIVICQATGDSVVIDAPAEPEKIVKNLKDTNLRYILLTHGHVDHIGALTELHSKLHVPLAAHPAETNLPVTPEINLNDGDKIVFGDIELSVLYTPGHTRGSVCLLWEKYLFSGDTIFPGGPGNTQSAGDFKQIVASITEKIFTLPDDTELLPGHGVSTIVKKEKGEYADFSKRRHNTNLCGDVLWRSS